MTYWLRRPPFPDLEVDPRTGPIWHEHPLADVAQYVLWQADGVWYRTPTSVGVRVGWETPAELAGALTQWLAEDVVAYDDEGQEIRLPPLVTSRRTDEVRY